MHNQNATQRVVRDPNEVENFSCIKTVCKDFKFDSEDIGRQSEEQAGGEFAECRGGGVEDGLERAVHDVEEREERVAGGGEESAWGEE